MKLAQITETAPRVVVLSPSAFAPKWARKPKTDVAIGIRPIAQEDVMASVAAAAEETAQVSGIGADEARQHYEEALMAHVVAAACCDVNDAGKHYWECGADEAREALTPGAVRRLFDELELVTIETGVARPEATEPEREQLARLLRGRRWRSFAANAPAGKLQRMLKIIRFALDEIESEPGG